MTVAQVMAYIARRPECGCVTAISVDDKYFKKQLAEDIAEWIRDGRTVERVTLDEGKTQLKSCFHDAGGRARKQAGLL